MSGAGSKLAQAFERRILLMDGAMGTMIQARDLSAQDFGGAQLEGCNEHLNLTRPDVIRAIHEAYLDAGADLISPNTFGCAPYVLAEYGLADRCHEITLAGARLAREAVPVEEQHADSGSEPGLVGDGYGPVAIHLRDDIAGERKVGPRPVQPRLDAAGIRRLALDEAQRNERVEPAELHQRSPAAAIRVRGDAMTSAMNGSPASVRAASSALV